MTSRPNLKLRRVRIALAGVLTVLLVGFCFNNCSSGFSSVSGLQNSASIGPSNSSNSSLGMATLTWQAPAQNTDGSSLTDLAGYHIYYGTSQSTLNQVITVSDPSATSYQINNLPLGTWYFAVAAFNTSGVESARSNVGSKTIQ